MAENKMEQVAKMFGKKLGEEFTVIYCEQKFTAKFLSSGLYGYTPSFDRWSIANGNVLMSLLTGGAVILDE